MIERYCPGTVPPPLLQDDTCSVMRIFHADGLNPGEKILAHMGEDKPLAPQFRSMCIERLIVEVVFHLLIEEVGLAREMSCESKMKNGRPPKWSPCPCVSPRVSIWLLAMEME